jgi:NADH-quinone oxidoreductase subunit L
VLLAVAALTAFYMFRLYFRIFWGAARKYEHAPHEAPAVMTVPLIILAALTCVTGFVPFSQFVSPDGAPFAMHIAWWIASAGIAAGVAGIVIAARFYMRGGDLPSRVAARWAGFWRAAAHRFYIDEAWQFVTKKIIFRGVSTPVAWFDRRVVDGGMNALGKVTARTAEAIRPAQSGKVQTYAIVFVAAVLVITLAVFML